MSLNKLRDEALRIAVEHGFTDNSPGEDVALMHSEISEVLEDLRSGHFPADKWYEEKITAYCGGEAFTVIKKSANKFNDDGTLRKPGGVGTELADEIIRIMHFCGKHGIDIANDVAEKMAYNETRPFKHGKKF